MVKYWTRERVLKERERENRRHERAHARFLREEIDKRTYTKGDLRKNARVMLDSLGIPSRRKMLASLKRGGELSVSSLGDPFRITLPAALRHVYALERAGLITTRKEGRIRFCKIRMEALSELAHFLTRGVAFLE